MTFNEWIDFKEQVHEMNDKAIEEVYGLDEDTTESFASCCTTADEESKQDIGSSVNTSELTAAESCVDNSQHNQSAAGSLNDTWEIQERMLALAEKLERGEDIPELGSFPECTISFFILCCYIFIYRNLPPFFRKSGIFRTVMILYYVSI